MAIAINAPLLNGMSTLNTLNYANGSLIQSHIKYNVMADITVLLMAPSNGVL